MSVHLSSGSAKPIDTVSERVNKLNYSNHLIASFSEGALIAIGSCLGLPRTPIVSDTLGPENGLKDIRVFTKRRRYHG